LDLQKRAMLPRLQAVAEKVIAGISFGVVSISWNMTALQRVLPTGGIPHEFPISEDVAVFITWHTDPASRSPYLWCEI
jgi:hypothetical protein